MAFDAQDKPFLTTEETETYLKQVVGSGRKKTGTEK